MATTTTNTYEGMFLLGSAGADGEKAVGMVRTLVEKHGGEVLVVKKWDERKLAFEIGKAKRGTYVLAYYKAAPTAIVPLERDVKLSEDFLRVLNTRADFMSVDEMKAVEPQPIAPPPERNSWDRPEGGGFGGSRGPRGPRRDEQPAPAGADAKD